MKYSVNSCILKKIIQKIIKKTTSVYQSCTFIIIIFFCIIFNISTPENLFSAENVISMKTEMITAVQSWNNEVDQNMEVPEMEYNDYQINVESVTSNTTVYVGHIHSVTLVINSDESENITNIPLSIYFAKCIDDNCTTTKEFFSGSYTIPTLAPGLNEYTIKFIVPKLTDQSGEYTLFCSLHNKDLKDILNGLMTDDQVQQIYSKASVKVNLDASNITTPDVILWDMKLDDDQGPFVLIENTEDNQQLIKGTTTVVSLAKDLTSSDEVTIQFYIENMDGTVKEQIMVWDPTIKNFAYSIQYPELKEYAPVVLDTDLLVPNSIISLINEIMANESEGTYDFKITCSLFMNNENQIYTNNNDFQCIHPVVKTDYIEEETRSIDPYTLIDQSYSKQFGNDTLNLNFYYGFNTSYTSDYTKFESKNQIYAEINFFYPLDITNIEFDIKYSKKLLEAWTNGTLDLKYPTASICQAAISVVGHVIWERTWSAGASTTIPVFDIYERHGYSFTVIVVTVPVTIAVYGYGQVDGSIRFAVDSKLRASFTPGAEMGIKAGAFVGFDYEDFLAAAVGLSGNIRLLRYELAANQYLETQYLTDGIDYNVILQTDLTHTIKGPHGRLSIVAYAKIPWPKCTCKWYKGCCPKWTEKTKTLVDYTLKEYDLDWEKTFNLYSHKTTYTIDYTGNIITGIIKIHDENQWVNLSNCDPRPCVPNSCLTELYGEQHCLHYCP